MVFTKTLQMMDSGTIIRGTRKGNLKFLGNLEMLLSQEMFSQDFWAPIEADTWYLHMRPSHEHYMLEGEGCISNKLNTSLKEHPWLSWGWPKEGKGSKEELTWEVGVKGASSTYHNFVPIHQKEQWGFPAPGLLRFCLKSRDKDLLCRINFTERQEEGEGGMG